MTLRLLPLLALLVVVSSWAHAPSGPNNEELWAKRTPREIVIKVAAAAGIDKRILLAIWHLESNQQAWSKRGLAGEYGPFQILPSTGKRWCRGDWKRNFTHNARCAAVWIKRGKRLCRLTRPAQIGEWYNRGKCRWRNFRQYALRVQDIVRGEM